MTTLQHSPAWVNTSAALGMFNAFQTAAATLIRYTNAYSIPFIIATNYFNQVEQRRFWKRTPQENLLAYLKLANMNLNMAGRALKGDLQAVEQFLTMEIPDLMTALANGKPAAITTFTERMQRFSALVAYTYPDAIEAIKSEFGFHFERQPASSLVDETDRFRLYQVMPTEPNVKLRENAKPILIVPPLVLGANILAFLPMEKRSYAHAFANQGFPTYVRVLKDIQTNEAVQTMGLQEDVKDMRRFCETIKARNGMALTLNGYCQGGFTALCCLLSGELDGLVDAFLTCVSPMDGSRGQGLSQFLKQLPRVFNDLAYGTKVLPNGNHVADGTLMGWVYKLKSISSDTPLLAMWRDMLLLSKSNGDPPAVNKTAAALNYWLIHDRNDLPLKMTQVSFDSFNTPIGKDGSLPITLGGRPLNLKRIEEKKIPWLICYGKQDDLVEPVTALAPTDYVNAEVSGFPKGHVAIATSWSHPESAYALHRRYPDEGTRGPVRFQLDLQQALDDARARAVKKSPEKIPAPPAAPSTVDTPRAAMTEASEQPPLNKIAKTVLAAKPPSKSTPSKTKAGARPKKTSSKTVSVRAKTTGSPKTKKTDLKPK
ncbi:MAG: metal transporter [Desulfatitalea sp.]|nr:metal transporter [Desulfatitalea sp.]NNK01853.1 metal transporter [Desulfatitalea sp.]